MSDEMLEYDAEGYGDLFLDLAEVYMANGHHGKALPFLEKLVHSEQFNQVFVLFVNLSPLQFPSIFFSFQIMEFLSTVYFFRPTRINAEEAFLLEGNHCIQINVTFPCANKILSRFKWICIIPDKMRRTRKVPDFRVTLQKCTE